MNGQEMNGQLLIDGVPIDYDEFKFDTPRLAHKLLTDKTKALKVLGRPGFGFSVRADGDVPAWVDGKEHDVTIRAGQNELTVRVPIRRYLEKNRDHWYAYGVLTDGSVPRWEPVAA